jgi:Topoisomerase DNA binding C4 zinc finger
MIRHNSFKMSFLWRSFEVWLFAAGIFGFAWAFGSAMWRLYTGRRTPFGEVFSHWDFKDGFLLAFLFPLIGSVYLWRRVTRCGNGQRSQAPHDISDTVTAQSRSRPNLITHRAEPAAATNPLCPKCGYPMRTRSGKFGEFWGCNSYPQCKGTRNIAGRAR